MLRADREADSNGTYASSECGFERADGRDFEEGSNAQAEYRTILRPDVPLHPIPFFGNLESARVLTIGLNPSSTEFEPRRMWLEEQLKAEVLVERLVSYFRSTKPGPHPWFGHYQEVVGSVDRKSTRLNSSH